MIVRRRYKYKATSSHCDPTTGAQAAFWVSVELLKARGYRGGMATSVCHILLCSPASLRPSTFPQLLPGLTAAPLARCACRDMSGNRTFPHVLSAWGQLAFFFPPSTVFISKHFRVTDDVPRESLGLSSCSWNITRLCQFVCGIFQFALK